MTPRGRLMLWIALLAILVAGALIRGTRKSIDAAAPASALQVLSQFEEQEGRKYWAAESEAEESGRVVEKLWDQLNASTNKLSVAASTDLASIRLGRYPMAAQFPHRIQVRAPDGQTLLSGPEWKAWVESVRAGGWELEQCEFRHIAFTRAPSASRFYFSAHLRNLLRDERVILEGDLTVKWQGAAFGEIDASGLQIRSRRGAAPFRPILIEEVQPVEGSYFIDPLILWDLDHDGATEIILAAKNRVYRRTAEGKWSHSPLCEADVGLIFTGALGDFSGNGTLDFLCAKFDGLFLYEGASDGRFREAPRQVWAAQPRLKYAQTIAVGDVDGDGDIDVFLGQYKVPYDKGQMPQPYFDANDSHPSFLLQNDGQGNFTDVTQKSGLGAKRGRRAYNATLLDLDRDGALDLVVVSDFAGLDAYRNDGAGRFKEVTSAWFSDPRGFGMASGFADFNRDGWLDVLMVGMNSPVADRLASLGLRRPYDIPDEGMRDRVTFGNRLFFGGSGGTFQQNAMSRAVARTGWSWGCAAEDLDNDGFPDLYVANGHETRASVRDYEPEFWLHDIYVGNSTENSLAQLYFREKMSRTRGQGWSYGGYEKNRLFLNLGGTNFVECGYLMGVALESDCRNVVAEDVDGDGRLDLIVTTFEIYPRARQTLQVFRNELDVPETFPEARFDDLKQAGQVATLEGGVVQPILSSGSYRSQTQPRLRGPGAVLARNKLLRQGEIRKTLPHAPVKTNGTPVIRQ